METNRIYNQSKELNLPIILNETKEFLERVLQEKKPKKILEIGTAIGYSASVIISFCKNAKLVTVEKDKYRHSLAKENLKGYNIKCINADAIDFLKNCSEKFDFVFLDGPKGQYINYFPYIKNLLNSGGIMFADNVHFHGMVNGKEKISSGVKTLVKNLRLFTEEVLIDSDFETKVLEVGDGILISKKLN